MPLSARSKPASLPAAMAENDRSILSKIVFLVQPEVHVLDLAGPLQALFEANQFGACYRLIYTAASPSVTTAQGLQLAGLAPFPEMGPDDMVLVPGMDSCTLDSLPVTAHGWLNNAYAAGASIGSICTGAFVLAEAGLLDNRACTTHWKVSDRLQDRFPSLRVQRNRLFVEDGRVMTSAGITSGIDMALRLIERAHGALMAARVAREMVVYRRRNGDDAQESIFLSYRTHLNEGVHRVQDWLISHPDTNYSLEELSHVARMSSRHLTRVFREETGITLKTFVTQLRLEVAAQLLNDPTETVDNVATQCGYQDARQLRRIFKRHLGATPSQWQRQRAEKRAS